MPLKPLMRRRDSASRGRHLVADDHVSKGQLIFCERPMIALQSTGNVHSGALCCHYCMAFVGTPEQSLDISTDPSRLPGISTTDDQNDDGEHALIPCKTKCGQVYCSIECQQDDWEWGGHKELCTGWVDDVEHPLIRFKQHAIEANEIFLLIAQWIARIHKHDVPYNEDDSLNVHPYTDFMMKPWWDVATLPLTGDPMGFADAIVLEKSCKRLCNESHAFLKEAWPEYESSEWLTPLSMARLIGSLEQNCVGVRRKHALRLNILQDTDLRHSYHAQLLKCLERAGMIGDGDEDGEGDEEELGEAETVEKEDTENESDGEKGDDNDDEWDYSYDEIATFLSNLPSPLNIGSDDEWDEIFTPLDGTAHFSTLTKMNHSCSPNTAVLYKTRGWGKNHPLVAYCIALRDIEEGEELTISYIENSASFDERQAALANYGFSCACSKCEGEKNIRNGKVIGEASGAENDQEDNLFGSNSDEESDQNEVTSLFGSDDEESESNEEQDALTGETKLQNAAERFESFLNKSSNAAIPFKYLAPVSTHVVKLCSTIIQEGPADYANFALMQDLLSKCIVAIHERDFSLCRIVGSDLEIVLSKQLREHGSWPTVLFRHGYWCACTTAAIGYAHECSFLVAIAFLDKALIMGQNRKQIEEFFSYVELFAAQMALAPCPPAIDAKVADVADAQILQVLQSSGLSQPISYPVAETTADPTEFVQTLSTETRPVVRRCFARTWKAVIKWRDIDVLVRHHGHRLVPIEVGSMDNGMKEELVSFRTFVSSFLSPSSKSNCTSLQSATDKSTKIAYLAQHPLLDQIPCLYDDVPRQPYGLAPTNVNIWMGTGGTRTPLHFDSYDNVFVQLVGAKYVRLYDKDQTSKLYVSKNSKYGLQGNMSQVNCENEDYDAHPLAKDAKYTEVLLLPGDCLFIPSRHWHYVRSLSTSISINYWF